AWLHRSARRSSQHLSGYYSATGQRSREDYCGSHSLFPTSNVDLGYFQFGRDCFCAGIM
ncbi:hypothetical protein LTR43_012565, partial [Exophiala xenobiotica]